MYRLIGLILLLAPFLGVSQTISKTEIFPIGQFEKLLNSPYHVTCSSAGEFYVSTLFWHNKMPLADNDCVYWHCGISPVNDNPMAMGCWKFRVDKAYLFFDTEVYVFTYDLTNRKKEDAKKIYASPQYAVIEYYDEETKSTGYLLAKGPFAITEVQ